MVSPSGTQMRVRLEPSGPSVDPWRMRARLRRPSLLAKFSFLSLLVIAALGVGIGSALHGRIERRALLEATQFTDAIVRVGLQPRMNPDDLRGYLSLDRLNELDSELQRNAFRDL